MEETPALNLAGLAQHFSDERKAYELVESIRWPNGPVCPKCGVIDEAYSIKPQKTRSGKLSQRKLWKCKACKRQFTVTVGTIFERSHIPLSKWLLAIYLMCSGKNGVSAHELHRDLGIKYQSAWFLAHRIRAAMARPPLSDKLAGIVEADETWIGGKRHNVKNPPPDAPKPKASRMVGNKSTVMSVLCRDTGEVRSQVIANVTSSDVGKVLRSEVDESARLMTDKATYYKPPGQRYASHERVDHARGEYVRGDVTTNTIEGFFGQLKRSLDGTFHHVSAEHLHRYLHEFDLRYSTRKQADGVRVRRVIEQAGGRRLTYREPTGR